MKFKNNLTAERVRELLDYDPLTGVFHWKVSPAQSIRVGDVAGSFLSTGYRRIVIDSIQYQAHRIAWLHYYGRWPQAELDHINRIKEDNRITNLREATRSQNAANFPLRRDNKLGIRGVCLSRGKYVAQIRCKHLGCFVTAEEASATYQKAARELFGEFATAA
jgi:hypothetical protein